MRTFAHLFPGKPSGLNSLNILRGNPHLAALTRDINQAVVDDFAAAREAVQVRAERAEKDVPAVFTVG